MIVVYGRRRIGKTFLLQYCLKDKNIVYHLSERINNLELFCNNCAVAVPDVQNLKQDFRIIIDFVKDKVDVLVFDEFQNLIQEDKNYPYVLQSLIDTKLRFSNLKLVLIGSSISMMKSHVLSDPSPLFGRKTASLKLTAMTFLDLVHFFPKKSFEEWMDIYGFADGIPFYLDMIDPERPFWEWLQEEIQKKTSFLKNEMEFLLKYEFVKPEMYMRILEKIAFGNTQLKDIATKLDVKTTDLTPYVSNLLELEFIKKERPYGEPPSSRKTRYYLKDNFLKFWFRYIFPNLSQIELGLFSIEKIKELYPVYLGFIFEEVVFQYLIKIKPFEFSNIGRWWWRNIEIDLIAFDDRSKTATFVECKWSDGVNPERICKSLLEKILSVKIQKSAYNIVIFAKSFQKNIRSYQDIPVQCVNTNEMFHKIKETINK